MKSLNQSEVLESTVNMYFKPMEDGLLSFRPKKNKEKWFTEKQLPIINNTEEDLASLINYSGGGTNKEAEAMKFVQNGTYSEIIQNVPGNFFPNLKSIFSVVEDNCFLINNVIDKDYRIHFPVINSSGTPLVFRLTRINNQVKWVLNYLSHGYVWDIYFTNIFILPKHKK